MRTVAIDFESFFSSRLKYSLRTSIAEQYCKSEHFDAYLISVYDGTDGWCGAPKDFNFDALDGTRCLAHNRFFDHTVWNELHTRGLCPKPGFKEFHCTANLTSYLANRRSLEAAAEHLLGIKISKAARADANGKHWPQDFSEVERATMLKYAQDDTIHCWNLWDRFNHKWPDVEKKLSNITVDQCMRGVAVNTELLDEYTIAAHDAKQKTEALLPWIKDVEDDDESWEGFNQKPSSVKCVAEQCRRSGIPCPPIKSESEEDFLLWEATYGPAHKWIPALSSWRSINRLLKTFQTMKARLRPDGTMPFSLLYFGAHTGRFSGSGNLNMQNLRREPVFINAAGLMETSDYLCADAMDCKRETGEWPHWVLHAIDIRALIIPRPGRKMIVSDLSQIEPRVLAWLSGDTQTLDLIRGGMGIYEAHARLTMGWKGGNLKSEDSNKYALAKARQLGLGFGCAWEKFISMAKTLSGLDITQDDPEFVNILNPISGEVKQVSGYGATSKAIVKAFRDSNPKIVALWKTLDENMKRHIGGDFQIELPNGRKMTYEKVRCERRIEQDPETKLPRSRSVFTVGVGGFKRVLTYGAKLTENITQATARDVFGEQIVAMDARGWKNLFSSHDEAILEVDQDVTAKDVEQEMSRCPDWLEGCPIAAEAKEVAHYLK